MNLYDETLQALKDHGLYWKDILYVSGNDFIIPTKNFLEIALRTNYDDGYGRPEIALDLRIYTHKGVLSRWEYDGSEGWEWIPLDKALWTNHEIDSVYSEQGWETLADIYKRRQTQ